MTVVPVSWVPPALSGPAPAGDACARLFGSLADAIDSQLPGTLGDRDIEFLHQLRVAVRRTRSGLKAFRGVYPAPELARFATGFGWLQQATGAARDLDVQVFGYDAELAHLSGDPAAALEPLHELLIHKRETAHWTLRKALTSTRYGELLRRWRRFLAHPADGPEAATPVREVADQRIRRAYRRVVKPARRITGESPAEALHDVRKRAKELRYLLEFFAGLYPKSEITRQIRSLKKLQDNLGGFQDAQVQAAHLAEWGEELSLAGAEEATMLALGELIVHHQNSAVRLRAEFGDRFARFDAASHRRQFADLFGA
ncbi:MAG: CHAD domain-containing protein [Micromonosporaceae bacterium]